MKKKIALFVVLAVFMMACTCPLTGFLQGEGNAQTETDINVEDLTIALTEAAMIVEETLTGMAPTAADVIAATEVPTEAAADVLGIGSSIVREKDGMEMMYVPAGSFLMGSESGWEDERPVHEVYLDAFWIDKFEVTNAQYQQCVADQFCVSEPAFMESLARDSYYNDPAYADYPVIYLDYYQAFDYCLWAGDRNGTSLPTEAQWEKAARGTDERMYPWGNQEPDCTLENMAGCSDDTVRVGSFPAGASPYGVMDMAGNVWEWTQDYYDANFYGISPSENPEGPAEYSDMRVIRGGSLGELEENQRTARRYSAWEGSAWFSLGFRCAIPAEKLIP